MKKIESEAELFSHLKDMIVKNLMSTIDIPQIGTFKIFLREAFSSAPVAI